MKVRCKKLINPVTGEIQQISPYLTIDKEYIVLEIECSIHKGCSYRLVGDDENGMPGLWSALQFEILDNKKAINWDFRIGRNGYIVIGPTPWLEPGYWERAYDRDPQALEIYRQEASAIYAEYYNEDI